MKKWGHLSIYHVYEGMVINMPNWLIFVFSAHDSKKLVTVCAKYLNASERSYRVLSENAMVKRLWIYRS